VETVILVLAPIVSVIAAIGLRRWWGPLPALLTVALAAAVGCYLAAAAGRSGASILAAIACLAACAGLTGELAGWPCRPRGRSPRQGVAAAAPARSRELRLRGCDEFEPEDWDRVEAAIPNLAVAGDDAMQRVDLYRFPRAGRSALIVLVRRDGAGGVLGAATYDLELQHRCERRRRRAWPLPPPGRDRA
jgi:hypothetical protein